MAFVASIIYFICSKKSIKRKVSSTLFGCIQNEINNILDRDKQFNEAGSMDYDVYCRILINNLPVVFIKLQPMCYFIV